MSYLKIETHDLKYFHSLTYCYICKKRGVPVKILLIKALRWRWEGVYKNENIYDNLFKPADSFFNVLVKWEKIYENIASLYFCQRCYDMFIREFQDLLANKFRTLSMNVGNLKVEIIDFHTQVNNYCEICGRRNTLLKVLYIKNISQVLSLKMTWQDWGNRFSNQLPEPIWETTESIKYRIDFCPSCFEEFIKKIKEL